MNLREYQEQSMTTAAAVDNEKDALVVSGLGLTGEAGEYADLIKKYVAQGHNLNKETLLHELGDVLWYIAYAAQTLGSSIEDVADMNITKLKVRYPEGFTTNRSINR